MAPRYYRVVMGYRGDDAKKKFIEWLGKRGQERTNNRNNGRARPEKIELYLEPFGMELEGAQRLKASAEAPAWGRVSGVAAITTRVSAELPAGGYALPLKRVKAARVVVKTGQAATGKDRSSHITGLTYKDYEGTSFSIPFGRDSAGEEEVQARTRIKNALLDAKIAVSASKVNFTEEDI